MIVDMTLGLWALPLITSGANTSISDSLKVVLSITSDPGRRIQIYTSLAEVYKSISADSCNFYLGQAQKLFPLVNPMPYLGKVYELKGDAARLQNNFAEMIRFYKIADYCYGKTGEKEAEMMLQNVIANNFSQAGNIAEAFRYYLRAKEIAEEVNDSFMLAKLNNNLGRIFVLAQQFNTGIDYFRKALAVFKSRADTFRTGVVLMNLGSAYVHTMKLDSARICTNEAIEIFKLIHNRNYLGSSYQIYAFSLLAEKRFPEAIDYLKKTLSYAMEQSSDDELSDAKILQSDGLVYLGIAYQYNGDDNLAKRYLFRGYHLSDSLMLLDRTKDALEFLGQAYEKLGMIDSSLYYNKLFKIASDSLMNMKSINIVKLAEVQMDYEKQVKEKKIELEFIQSLRKRNLVIFIGAGLFLLSVVLILILKLRIEKHKKMQVQIEKRQVELERQAAAVQLEAQNKELTINVMSLIRKNEFILDLSNQLIRINDNMEDERAGVEIVKLVKTMQKNSEGSVWEEFEMRFKQVHGNYYDKLLARFPDLTPNDLKLCALLKLNLSTKDICELSGQRPATLDVARYRLRKKLGISNSQVNLVTFLSQV